MKFNLPMWGVALLIIAAIVAGYFASMAMERMKVKKDSSEEEVDLTDEFAGDPPLGNVSPNAPLPTMPVVAVDEEGNPLKPIFKKVV